ncbi:MAG: DNA-3-methyladenine glycosylase [Oscillospiraceae bacterium]|nr:DNA-3-methyladenine glycosylase [Oscillospiraceae bacterium]
MAMLSYEFFRRPCLEVAHDLVGKLLVRRLPDGTLQRLRISETEAYCGEEDTACHAHKGRTKRTEVLYADAGTIYVYLCYGIHWLLNIVTGEEEQPQAVLIRACVEAPGPGRLTKALSITGDLNRKSILAQEQLWVEDDGFQCDVVTDKRVGIGYASQEDQDRLWRFIMNQMKTPVESMIFLTKLI